MAQKGFDFFIAKPDSGEENDYRVCNARCKVMRNVFGPTGFVSAMANTFTYHNEFVCPHTDEPWHN